VALKALIFDVDGTLAETEEAHRAAFNLAFAEAGLDWHWDQTLYRALLRVTGGKERIAHFAPDTLTDIAALHAAKNRHYAKIVARGEVELLPGVFSLIVDAAAREIMVALATTTSRTNVDSLIAATPLVTIDFAAIVTGEDVVAKKPDPEAYQIVLKQLGIDAHEALAFEDSPNGLKATSLAAIDCIVIPSLYTIGDDFTGAHLLLGSLEAFCLQTALADFKAREGRSNQFGYMAS
jgi:HAD superfamily hydrolase (TIGR01509 family)